MTVRTLLPYLIKNIHVIFHYLSRSHTAIVHKIELFSNKLFFVSGSHDKTLKVWNFNGECVQTLTDNDENGIRCLKLLYEGEKQLLLASSYNRIKMYDLTMAECVSVLTSHGSDILCMELLTNQPSMNVLASGDQEGRIKLWDLKRMLFTKNLLGHKNDILCLKVNFLKIYFHSDSFKNYFINLQ
jgi:WD40 repeat protein